MARTERMMKLSERGNYNVLEDATPWFSETSSFPEVVDVFERMEDVSTQAEIDKIKLYNSKLFAPNLADRPNLEDPAWADLSPKIYNAKKYNKVISSILAIQNFIIRDVYNWVLEIRDKVIGKPTDTIEENTFYGKIAVINQTIRQFVGTKDSVANTETIEGAKKLFTNIKDETQSSVNKTIEDFKDTGNIDSSLNTIGGLKNYITSFKDVGSTNAAADTIGGMKKYMSDFKVDYNTTEERITTGIKDRFQIVEQLPVDLSPYVDGTIFLIKQES